ncbi:MAG: phosphoenolpyruvate--protein phosphotransferase [Planctomycetota bacterium]
MRKLQGIAVSPGVAIGEVLVMDNEGFRIPRRFVSRDAVEDELERLDKAITAAGEEIARSRDAVSEELGDKYGAIFEAHRQMLQDTGLRSELDQMIRDRHYSPEYAVSRTLRRYAQVFQRLEGHDLAERAHDIFDIEKRLLRNLLGRSREGISHLTSPVLVLAHSLTPSETAKLDPEFVKGFVTEVGGPGSHTAILAEALEIPAVVGTGLFLAEVSGGELAIIDGDQGLVILSPDEETIARYRHEVEEHRSLAARLSELRDLPTETADGVRVLLLGNIEFPHEVDHCLDRGADGVGLYRTEFLYLGAETEPDEEVHFEAYSRVVKTMAGLPVTIRTFDLGADKVPHLPEPEDERNPFLGLRSIRLALRNLPMFRTQLRAALRASALGKVRIMFPLVSTLHELRQAKMVLTDVIEDLVEHQVAFDPELLVGMMVEVPSAVMMIDQFVEEVDFLSIGTNDLIQYTLAVDRSNKDVVGLYNAADPAVLKLIHMTIQAAGRKSIPVNLCGQMSGSPTYTMLLLGMGLRRLSMTPSAIFEVKKVCRSVTIEQCEAVARRAMSMENARNIQAFLKEELRKYVPELGL